MRKLTALLKHTSDNPKLPKHDEGAADAGRGHLSGIDRHCSVLCADTDTHDKTGGEELLPRACKSGADRSSRETQSSNEDFAATSKVVIERINDESATICDVSSNFQSQAH